MKPFYRVKLYQAIFIPFIILLMSTLVVLSINGFYRTQAAAEQLTSSILQQETQILSQSIENQFNQTDTALQTLAKMLQSLSIAQNQDWLRFQLSQWSSVQKLPAWLVTDNQGSLHTLAFPIALTEYINTDGLSQKRYVNPTQKPLAETEVQSPVPQVWQDLFKQVQQQAFAWHKDEQNFYLAYAVPSANDKTMLVGTELNLAQMAQNLDQVMAKMDRPIFYILDAQENTLFKPENLPDFTENKRLQTGDNILIRSPLKLNHNTDWQLVISISSAELVAPINRNLQGTLWQTLLSLTGISFIIFILSLRAGKPLRQVQKNAELLCAQRYNEMKPIFTFVEEYQQIDGSLQDLKNRYEAIQRYVPTPLIEQLKHTANALEVHGDLKRLSMLNIMIPKFTQLTADFNPQQMVHFLSVYQSVLYDIINEKKGIVDQVKGNQVFAYWGAPIATENDVFFACQAALNAKKHLNKLNTTLSEEGYPMINTYISLMQGNAVVGNFGSIDRMVYTAVGGEVNEAQNLSLYNAQYGTQIIVCEHTHAKVKEQFLMRKLDVVFTQISQNEVALYELIAWKNDPLSVSLAGFIEDYEAALQLRLDHQLDEAQAKFNALSISHPHDEAVAYQLGMVYQLKLMES